MEGKGIVFVSDVSVALIILLGLIYIILFSSFSVLLAEASALESVKKEKNALLWVDSLVKNSSEQGFGGAAFMDLGKKRVKSNLLSYSKLKSLAGKDFKELEKAGVKTKDFYITYSGGRKETLYKDSSPESPTNCLVIERFVLIDGLLYTQKALLGLVVCDA